MSTPERMTLHSGQFETMAFFLGVMLEIELIRDGKSSYLEGVTCIAM
jgi:Ca2+/H+ antiporter